MTSLNPRRITYLPLEEVITEPRNGHWEIWVDCWWAHQPGKGLILYAKNPQCNRIESIARKVQETCYPDAEVIQVPTVYLPHDCGRYV